MGRDINGYMLIDGLRTENAGMCQWGFASKNGHEYFIKEFLSPKYPLSEEALGPELTREMRNSADKFFQKKQQFYYKLSQCRTGNIMIMLDFFRCGSKYYTVTDKVAGELLSVSDVAQLPDDQKYTLIRSILYSISTLHDAGIVHSDLRPENLLIKRTRGEYCTAKIIDFDAGFLDEDPPERIEGSQNYFSPEAIKKTHGSAEAVTTKADIWALGLLIHQYWCGRMPIFPEKYHYASEAVLNHNSLQLDDSIPSDIRLMLNQMLMENPEDRPTAKEAWRCICDKTGVAIERDSYPEQKTSSVRPGWFVPDDLG